jgi:hypothetical protein
VEQKFQTDQINLGRFLVTWVIRGDAWHAPAIMRAPDIYVVDA